MALHIILLHFTRLSILKWMLNNTLNQKIERKFGKFLLSELNLAIGQEIQNQGAALGHGGAVGAARWTHVPTRRAAIKQCIAFDGHDEIDLPLGMCVVRAGHVLHIDHVDRETVQVV